MSEDKKKYNFMEKVLTELNRKFISLKDEETKRNNRILQSVLPTMIEKMKEQDPLFKAMYTIYYGSRYNDGLQVDKPGEFDFNLILSLPLVAQPVFTTVNIPGFVQLQLKKFDVWMNQPEAMPAYRNFSNLFDDQRYLHTQKVLAWIEGIVQRTLNSFPKKGSKTILENQSGNFEMEVHKGGPALTLKISDERNFKINVHLFTYFVFRKDKWPRDGFQSNPVKSKTDFFIVPKRPKVSEDVLIERYWRLSFQEQERVLLDGKLTLKPTFKLFKKIRDVAQQNCIADYYIKTVLLHIIETKDEDFWRNSLSYVFVTVLKEYQKDYIEKGNIPYYWNRSNNLIEGLSKATLEDINNRLKVIINDIEEKSNEPTTVAKYLLTETELASFMINELN